MLKIRLAGIALAVALFGGAASGALAQNATPVATGATTPATATQPQIIQQKGGAAGVVAAVVQAVATLNLTDTTVQVVSIQLDHSLNNLKALNNVLNNSPILNKNNIVITHLIDVGNVGNLVAIGVLQGGNLILFTK